MPRRETAPRDVLVVAGFLTALAVVLAGGIVAHTNMTRLAATEGRVSHSYEVVAELRGLLTMLTDAETGQRGYLLTGDAKYLEPYEDALRRTSGTVEHLRGLTADDARQQAQLAALSHEIDGKIAELRRTVAMHQYGDAAGALEVVRGDSGMKMMGAIRTRVAAMEGVERDLLAERDAVASTSATIALATNAVATALGLVLVGLVLLLSNRNVAIRRRAATEKFEEHEKLRTTLASIGDAVITTDTDGRVTELNRVAETLTGWPSAGAKGRPLDEVFKIVNVETRQPVENPASRALREGVVVGLANHTVLLNRDGGERGIDDSAAPIRHADGTIFGCVLVFRDVTERRRLEGEKAERLTSASFLAAIVESSNDAIVRKSTGGIIQTWNAGAERLFGWPAEEVIGKPITILIPRDRLGEEDLILERIRAGERVEHFETVRVRKDGSEVAISLTISPIRDETGKIVAASKIARDISERKKSEAKIGDLLAELRAADRRKDEFLATLAHELRGPLAPLRNSLEVMKRTDKEGLLVQPRETMERQLGQLIHLVDDLIDVSRITRGKVELRREEVELASILHHAMEQGRPICDAARHRLTMSLPPEPIYLSADPLRLVQVFGNLFSNACKYTEPGGEITVTAARVDGTAVVTMKDSGVGLTREQLGRIFEMFSQVDRSPERTQGGLGIGLTLAKRLVELHGGTIEATSEGPGKGSEFIVRLPALPGLPKADVVPGDRSKRDTVPIPRPSRVLVVDDNPDTAASLSMLLDLTGNETKIAKDGLEAVTMAAEFRPHVVLLDIGLPKLNGFEACRRIRSESWGRGMTVVALTGWGQEADRRKSKAAGFDYHMVKPVDYVVLMKILAERDALKGTGAA
ncbi:MAG TPA: PAS domain S-box protein [Candidatus Polarisedimenticolaceae bacterium]|nr:PAS domain S-box protein [Candidatus Polarisedimenticolaceae bacterium]